MYLFLYSLDCSSCLLSHSLILPSRYSSFSLSNWCTKQTSSWVFGDPVMEHCIDAAALLGHLLIPDWPGGEVEETEKEHKGQKMAAAHLGVMVLRR